MDQEHLMSDNCTTYSTNNSVENATCLAGNVSESVVTSGGLATLAQFELSRQVLFFYMLPCIAIVGVLGNTLSLSVLWENRGSHAFNAYLMALTSADILLLLLALSRCVILIVVRYPDVRYPVLAIYNDFYLGLVLGSWLQRISSTLISIIALERFVAVVFPFKVKSLALENHPAKIVILVVIGNALCQIPTVVLLDVKDIPVTNSTLYTLGLRYSNDAAELVRQVYLVFLAVINMFIPLLIVSVSTAAILICLKMRNTSIRLSRTSVEEARERNTMTLTLVSMAIIFTFCYIPAIIIYVVSADSEFRRREANLVGIAVDANIVCVCINSASDFLIYFLRSKQFRTLFASRFLPCIENPGSPRKSSLSQAVAVGDQKAFTTEMSRSPDTSVVMESDIIEM